MRTKTIFIIIFTVLITIFLMINTDAVEFNFIFGKGEISKLVVVGVCTFVGFILGYIAGKPKTVVSSYDDAVSAETPHTVPAQQQDGLTDEDREYIS